MMVVGSGGVRHVVQCCCIAENCYLRATWGPRCGLRLRISCNTTSRRKLSDMEVFGSVRLEEEVRQLQQQLTQEPDRCYI